MKRSECVLRPIGEEDLPLVLAWRNSEAVRPFMYTDHLISPEEHRGWFERIRTRVPVPFRVLDVAGRPVGVVSVTGVDEASRRCHWGFYVGEKDAPRGSGSALGWLGLSFVFGEMGMRKVVGEAFAFNEASLRFHRRLGFTEEGRFRAHVVKGGRPEDVVAFGLLAEEWERAKDRLLSACFDPEGG